jgi:N-acetyl-1-D-myo-inositol-2-amino-2-deoxy-alpha-D-glucopyranoside deacetylase
MYTSRTASLLAVFAHPDDEMFHAGILAHLAGRGVRVTLVSATHGEAGKVHDPSMRVADLSEVRAEEMRLSCERLGIEEPLILDFHDSGREERQRHEDPRALANVDMLEVEAAIRNVIRDVKPHVILTHDPHGGYYHPDHLAIHGAASAAFYSSGLIGDDAPERLFYSVIEHDVARVFSEATRGMGPGGGLDADVFGPDARTIAVTFDATSYMEQKLSVLAAYRSQFGLTLETLKNPPLPAAGMLRAFRPVMERESFVLGAARGPIPCWPLRDFFEGLESAELVVDQDVAERRVLSHR